MTRSLTPISASTVSTNVRQRTPWSALAGVMLVVLLTLGSAAANMMPQHIPTARELQRAEQNETIDARRARIAMLLAQGDQCRAPIARELSRALVFDGQSAIEYADDYARRCGEDPIVRRWADATLALAAHRASRLRRQASLHESALQRCTGEQACGVERR